MVLIPDATAFLRHLFSNRLGNVQVHTAFFVELYGEAAAIVWPFVSSMSCA